MNALFQLAYLCLDACSSVHGNYVYVGDILRKILQVVGNLQAQLTRRREHYGLSLLYTCVYALQQRNAEGGCLACSCLRKCNHIVTRSEQIRDNFFLYGHRMFETHLFNGAANLLVHAEFFKCLHYFLSDN